MNYHRKHHYFRNTAIILLLLTIDGGAYYYHQSNNQGSQQTTRQANQSQHNTMKHVHHHSHWTKVPVNHKDNSNKTKLATLKLVNKPGYTLSVLPKNIQGTWYNYDNGKLETLTITDDKISDSFGSTNGSTTIHAHPKKTDNMKISKHPQWSIAFTPNAIRGQHFAQIMGRMPHLMSMG